jgi:predicted nucleotidyltransferase
METLMTDAELLDRIAAAATALKAAGATEVYLFGSAATGNVDEDSDIDLAVVGLPPERFFRVMTEVIRILGRPLDLLDLDEATPLVRYLQKEGKLRRVA